MAITNATKLADFGSGIGTAGSVLEVDNDNDRIGIGTSNPNATLTAGAVGAAGTTLFVYGDARCLGVITATSFDDGSGGPIAGINTTGLSTFTQVVTSGITSVINTTAATSSSTGALIISGGVGIAKSLYVDGGISVAGTVTYNDVTNVDSVGIVTAGKGVRVTTGGMTMVGVATMGAVGASGTTLHVHGDGRITGVITATTFSGNVDATTVDSTTIKAGAGITLTASGIINAGFTTITGATETCTGVTTYLTPDSSSTKVTIECDAAKGTLFSHDLSDGNVGIVSLTNLPVRGNSFTTYTILFTQLSSTPVGKGNTLPKNGIGTNIYLDGGFTGFTTRGRVASASTVTLSATASDIDVITLGVHYNGSGTGGKENFKVYVSGDTGYRIGND